MKNASRYENYIYDEMLKLCEYFIENGFNPEITHRKGENLQLSKCCDYLKSSIGGILVDLHDLVFEEMRKHPELNPISIKGIKSKTCIMNDSITDYITGLFFDDKSGHSFTVYIDTTKMTTIGQIAFHKTIERHSDCQQLSICDDIESPSKEGTTIIYIIES